MIYVALSQPLAPADGEQTRRHADMQTSAHALHADMRACRAGALRRLEAACGRTRARGIHLELVWW